MSHNHPNFMDLPPEIRTMCYDLIFPAKTHFTITQRMLHRKDEDYGFQYCMPAPAPRTLVVSGWPSTANLSLLSTSKRIRAEVQAILQHNITGTFEIHITTKFSQIHKTSTFFPLITSLHFRRWISDSKKNRHALQFPNLSRVVVSTYIINPADTSHDLSLPSDSRAPWPKAVRTWLTEAIHDREALYHDIAERIGRIFTLCTNAPGLPYHGHSPWDDAIGCTPRRWRLNTGGAPCPVESWFYVLDPEPLVGNRVQEGVFVVVDWNRLVVGQCRIVRFERLRAEELEEGQKGHPCLPGSWRIVA